MKKLQLSKTHNDFLETSIIERKIQKVPKIWRLEPKRGSPATIELCSVMKIIKIYSYRYMTIFWKYPSENVKCVPPSQPPNHLLVFLPFSLFFFHSVSFFIFSFFVTLLISSHISPLFYLRYLSFFPIFSIPSFKICV